MTQITEHTPGPWAEAEDGWINGADGQPVLRYAGCGSHGAEWQNPADKTLALAAPKLYHVAKVIEAAYLEGPAETFHTRLNELAGGSFADLLNHALGKTEMAA